MVERCIRGRAASEGVAVGPAVILRPLDGASRVKGSIAEEHAALAAAVAGARLAVADLITRLDGDAAELIGFQLALLEDDALTEAAYAEIETGAAADEAWRAAMAAEIAGYETADDEYFRARASDLADIRDRVLRHLFGLEDNGAMPNGAIIVARDLAPSAFLGIDWSKGGGIALGEGSPTSHVAMLARGRGVPMVVGLGPAWETLSGLLLVEGGAGLVEADPSAEHVENARAQGAALLRQRADATAHQLEPALTRDGTAISVLVNISGPADMTALPAAACDGVGLARTEFLTGNLLRDEEAQYQAYAELMRWADGRPVTIRTLDAGGDKPIPGYTVDGESNPFLGLRGIRLSLRHPDIFRVQLRALARAAVAGPLKVMLPMVTNAAELGEARMHLRAVLAELGDSNIAFAEPAFGIMIEVPAAALAAQEFAADFFSIGTNDLTQYATAASRDGAEVADYADVLHPGVMAMIAHVVRAGRSKGVDVSICGDAAGDVRAIPALLKVGVRALSVSPGLLPQVKATIRTIDLAALAEDA
ncbi:Phosphotransferase system enzyme I (Phosphoenolpyruvate-protein phosphotransferase) [Bradyrhizobium sp. ORS 285]|uniref:phosphoenolpyruvate--protein phosphotransferase n=1 Tax=Bradyrhizobium sp. ORS 285 TaxID=115808 RepID=UPI00024066F6|nr:phosphoenolpyruvate--protein phosphotransferase [Bradyrhizobium sp. ORS 285]CCD83718.1 Phosphotransferase system enzyme I (Phosphoenolpyruvate-protein phosphotransferase) (major [Bradyrhizobium sp. ORS 285]SMX59264.1 Phosphotransferase system enzyme I (Phosphoenolpyruvate-protein phosphotransferase) [Bradyrhizobium sp. ORS 285]